MKHPRSSRAGYTLVELLIGGFFLASMLMVAGLATERTLASFRAKRAEQEVVVAGNRLLERLARELAFASRDGLGPPTLAGVGSERVDYRVATGGGAFSGLRRLELVLEPGELDNDLDDDGDGLVDEHEVRFTQDVGAPEELTVSLARGLSEYGAGEQPNGLDDDGDGQIDERGLSLLLDGDALAVEVTLLFATHGGAVRPRTLATTVFPRN